MVCSIAFITCLSTIRRGGPGFVWRSMFLLKVPGPATGEAEGMGELSSATFTPKEG